MAISSFQINITDKHPWGIVDASGVEYIVKKEVMGADYAVFLDFVDAFYPDRNDTDESMKRLFEGNKDSGLSYSGWVGFWTYDFLAAHMGVACKAARDIDMPDGVFVRPQTIIYFYEDKTVIESILTGRCEELSKMPPYFNARKIEKVDDSFDCNIDYEHYEELFGLARKEILLGNTYQIKISQRYSKQLEVHPLSVFLDLMKSNPSPESFLIQLPEFSLVSCSPETVIHKQGERIFTKPIGGTWERKSGMTEEGLISQFLNNEKEVSEHNMLVDLERNDLSRICDVGSVHIKKFQDIETYSHLYHLVTTIEGKLKREITGSDIIKAMLPGGSITGCPKYKTMELIDQFEPVSRGHYTGSFGMISDNGDMHLNLIIRTMLIIGDICYVQAGGGIIVDSEAKYEHNENFIKAKALLETIHAHNLQ